MEIKRETSWEPECDIIENQELVAEICSLILKREPGLSYEEANGVLYYADKTLHKLAIEKPMNNLEESSSREKD